MKMKPTPSNLKKAARLIQSSGCEIVKTFSGHSFTLSASDVSMCDGGHNEIRLAACLFGVTPQIYSEWDHQEIQCWHIGKRGRCKNWIQQVCHPKEWRSGFSNLCDFHKRRLHNEKI